MISVKNDNGFGLIETVSDSIHAPFNSPRENWSNSCNVGRLCRHMMAHSNFCGIAKKHIAADSWWEANEQVSRQVSKWRGEIVNLMDEYGLATANFGGYGPTSEPTFSYWLAQFEAGIDVYGRFGVCLNPDFGCYYKVGVLLTEAELSLTDKAPLVDLSS